jgi:hypothetical protein
MCTAQELDQGADAMCCASYEFDVEVRSSQI